MKIKTTIKIDEDVKKAGQEFAKQKNRSFSNLLEHLLIVEMKRRGALTDK